MFDAFTKTPTAHSFGFKVSPLRPTAKVFEDVWSKYAADMRETVEAIRSGKNEGQFIRKVYKNSKDKTGKLYFFIGYGKGNHAFNHPLHPQSGGYAIEENRHAFDALNVDELLESLKPYVEEKFLSEQQKGKATQKLRRKSKNQGAASANNAEAEALLAAAEELLKV